MPFIFRTMNKLSKYAFLTTILELHGLQNFDKLFSVFHWVMINKKYLIRHPYGNGNIF